MNKQALCEAFCGDLQVREVPAGLAVSTTFRASDGDAIDFYITRHPQDSSLYRFEDSGLVVPMLEAQGFSLDSNTRATAFRSLLEQYRAEFDEDALELRTDYISEPELAQAALRFMTLMVRVRDLELLSSENVESTFREDAEQKLRETLGDKAKLEFRAPITEGLSDYVADAVITPNNADGKKLAVYFATTESRVDEAVMVWMEQRMAANNPRFEVALLLEREKPNHISGRALRRAINRVGVATFRGDESGAMAKLASFARIRQGLIQ